MKTFTVNQVTQYFSRKLHTRLISVMLMGFDLNTTNLAIVMLRNLGLLNIQVHWRHQHCSLAQLFFCHPLYVSISICGYFIFSTIPTSVYPNHLAILDVLSQIQLSLKESLVYLWRRFGLPDKYVFPSKIFFLRIQQCIVLAEFFFMTMRNFSSLSDLLVANRQKYSKE